MLSPERSDELVSSLDGSNSEAASASSSLVETLVGQYRSALEKERTVFLIMLGLYGLVIAFGLLALLWHEKLGPRWSRRKYTDPDSKHFELEKSVAHHLPTKTQAQPSQLGAKLGSLVVSPLASLRRKKRNTSTNAFGNVHLAQNSADTETHQRQAFSPPPAYPPHRASEWQHRPSTLSLLGALNLPEVTESRQSVASVQPSSAGVSPTKYEIPALQRDGRGYDRDAPSLPAGYLYAGQLQQTRPVSSVNPFKTPFDDPYGK